MLAGKGETENALVYIKKADQLDPGNKVSFFAVPRALPPPPPLRKQKERKSKILVEIVKWRNFIDANVSLIFGITDYDSPK